MENETLGLGAGSYPTPFEEDMRGIEYTIYVTYKGFAEFPKKWDKQIIVEDIKENLKHYINESDLEEYEIEM